ncbi:hypothetical protein [Bacillus sp. 1P06AnD]|uniref:hypothetical protein n=1 Tax=Bacillus sp. 1P06AnD TaxID=3132208 RepID=UPI0039A23049
MRKSFNRFGNIEIEGNAFKYRIPIDQVGTDNKEAIEKDIKRKLQTIDNPDDYLLPSDIQIVNRYVLLYYDLLHVEGFDQLQQMSLEEKLPYFDSLVRLAQSQENGVTISWDKYNFVLDKFEKKLKTIIFETEYFKIYEPAEPLEAVKQLIIFSLTTLKTIINKPSRTDFINPDQDNISFVENLLKIDNLDDLSIYLDSLAVDYEGNIINQSEEVQEEQKQSKKNLTFKKKKDKPTKSKSAKKNTPRKSPGNKGPNSKKKKKGSMSNTKLALIVGAALLLVLIKIFSGSGTDNAADKAKEKKVATVEKAPELHLKSDQDIKKNKAEMFKSDPQYYNKLVQAYRYSYGNENVKAYQLIKNVPKLDLSASDIPLLVKVYDEANDLGNLLTEVPIIANDVIAYLLTQNRLDQLPDISQSMKVKNPNVEFEVGFIEKKYKYMLSYLNKVEINGRKEQQIVTAYLELGDNEQAKNFAEQVGNPDLIQQVEANNLNGF